MATETAVERLARMLMSGEITADQLPQGSLSDADEAQRAREAAAMRMRQSAQPEGGRQEGALSAALSDPATVFNASPLGMARDAMTAANEGNYGQAALSAAPLVAPALGPAVRAAGGLMQAYPKAAALVAALAGTGASVEAADRDPKNPEWWRSKREPPPNIDPFAEPGLTPEETQRYTAQLDPNFEKLGPMGKKEAMARRDAAQGPLTSSSEAFLKEKIARSRSDWDRTLQDKQAAYEAEQARLDVEDQKYREENQSFREAHPLAAPIIQGIGAGTALAFPLAARGMALRRNNAVASQLDDAVAAAEAASTVRGTGSGPLRVGASQRLKSAMGDEGVGRMANTSTPLPEQLAWALGGGTEGAATAVAPYIVDQETLPMNSHGREEAGDPMNWAARAGYGFIPGAAAGLFGARIPMGRGAVPDMARAEGALKMLGSKARDLKVPASTGSTADPSSVVLVDALKAARAKRSKQ
jgi:hypothetical protein